MIAIRILFGMLLLVLSYTVPARADELVMFGQQGCPFCAAWNREIGRVYANTDEAKRLPLRQVDIHAARPADLRAIAGIHFTPTFVVIHCGREADRIVGYAGQELFWEQLDAALKSIDAAAPASSGASCAK
ncbi:hypothetical protein EPN42_12200 [bacterium]|nr:MAG: hypothetical protein EPN42_12200 [bacterium]